MRARYTLYVGGGLRERCKSRRVVLITELMFEHKHSQIGADDGIQTYIQENTAYDEKPDLQHTMM